MQSMQQSESQCMCLGSVLRSTSINKDEGGCAGKTGWMRMR